MWATLPSLLHHAARRVASRKLSLLLLTLVSVGAWCLVVRGAFQYDDLPTIVRDPATQNLDALLGRLVTGVRPLTRISFFLNAALFGPSPAPFLAINLLLHLAAVLLVWALALTRLADARAALVAGMAFALQPAHAATIAYASGRSEGLSAMLVLSGLLLWKKRRTALALAVLAAACLARETALVFPVLLLVWEATRPETATEPSPASRRNALVLAAALASALALLLLALPRYRTLAAFSLRLRSPLATLVVNGRALPESLSLWVRPWALSVDHPFVPEGSVPASVLGLLLLAGGRPRRDRLAAAGAFPLAGGALVARHPRSDELVDRPARLPHRKTPVSGVVWPGPPPGTGLSVGPQPPLGASRGGCHRGAPLPRRRFQRRARLDLERSDSPLAGGNRQGTAERALLEQPGDGLLQAGARPPGRERVPEGEPPGFRTIRRPTGIWNWWRCCADRAAIETTVPPCSNSRPMKRARSCFWLCWRFSPAALQAPLPPMNLWNARSARISAS